MRQHKDRHLFFEYTEDAGVNMEHSQLTTHLTVAEVMDRWPRTIPVFFRYRTVFVACPIAPFVTLAGVAAVYGLDLDRFLNELRWTIQLREERS